MFETLTDGQYWSLCIMGAFFVALACGLVGCAADLIREGAE